MLILEEVYCDILNKTLRIIFLLELDE